VFWEASGGRTAGMPPKGFRRTQESRQGQAELVGSDKRARRGRPDERAEVRLAESTPRPGEPATWGSGQQRGSRSGETCAPPSGRRRSWMPSAEQPVMATGLDRRAAQARGEPQRRCPSLAQHITRAQGWETLCQIPRESAPGVDGQTGTEAKQAFEAWIEPMRQSVHRHGYQAPPIRRVSLPKPGTLAQRPLGGPCVAARALQRSAAPGLSAIDEQDVLPCAWGGRPGLSAHQALATLTEAIAGRKVGWVLEAALKNFFGS
jgi:hypothetical protein